MTLLPSGTGPTPIDHRDYDYIKTKKLGGLVPTFLEEYNVDAGLWIPDQNAGSDLFNPPVPPMPYGCTNYSQCELCSDEDGVLYDPSYLESITHANAHGGGSLRAALQAVVKHGVRNQAGQIIKGQHPAFFNVRAAGAIDWFDAARLAMASTAAEKRGVSVGTPWYPEFMERALLPIPDFSLYRASWHNWVIKGWKIVNGESHLIAKPHIGPNYGDKGFCYFSRPLYNSLMNIPGTAAFTLDKLLPGEKAVTIDTKINEWIVSLIRNLFHV